MQIIESAIIKIFQNLSDEVKNDRAVLDDLCWFLRKNERCKNLVCEGCPAGSAWAIEKSLEVLESKNEQDRNCNTRKSHL